MFPTSDAAFCVECEGEAKQAVGLHVLSWDWTTGYLMPEQSDSTLCSQGIKGQLKCDLM